jgi:hypothetical protein
MTKALFLVITLLISARTYAESNCDIRVGESVGLKVVEFATGHVVHSKFSLKETTADALLEEIVNLQDMGICSEKILSKKCVLKLEKKDKENMVTMYRGADRWVTWKVASKKSAQDFVKNMKRVGFCS